MHTPHKDARKLENWVTRWHPPPSRVSLVYWYFVRAWWAHLEDQTLHEDVLENLDALLIETLRNNAVPEDRDPRAARFCECECRRVLVNFCRDIGAPQQPKLSVTLVNLEDYTKDVIPILTRLLDDQLVMALESDMRQNRSKDRQAALVHNGRLTDLATDLLVVAQAIREGNWARVGTGTTIFLTRHWVGILPVAQRLIEHVRNL